MSEVKVLIGGKSLPTSTSKAAAMRIKFNAARFLSPRSMPQYKYGLNQLDEQSPPARSFSIHKFPEYYSFMQQRPYQLIVVKLVDVFFSGTKIKG